MEIYKCVIYRENLKISPIRQIIEKLFASRQKYTDEENDLMQELIKLIMNSLYGAQIRKDLNESFCRIPEHWMKTKYDQSVMDHWKLPNRKYIVKLKKYDGLDDNDCDIKNSLPAHLGLFILSINKRVMNYFI